MVEEIDLGVQAFAPVAIESLGDRDAEVLRDEYSSAKEQGISGTLLPSSAPGGAGGSLGFNASGLLPITVDPDIAGASYVIEPGSIGEKVGERTPESAPAGGYDRAVVRDIADKKMREAVGKAEARTKKEEPVTKKRTTREEVKLNPVPVGPEDEPAPLLPDPGHAAPAVRTTAGLPMKLIAFDFGPPMGTMECRYHDIFCEGNRLVLVWDVDCVTASKYVPARMPEAPIHVTVGKEREQYDVFSLGMEFTDETTGRFYIVLLVDVKEDHE